MKALDDAVAEDRVAVEAGGRAPDEVLAVLRRFWGFESLRPLQLEAIQAGLERRDSLVVMPTGGGKSLCYQVPPAVAGRTDVVVSPLIALMKDQVDALRAVGLSGGGDSQRHGSGGNSPRRARDRRRAASSYIRRAGAVADAAISRAGGALEGHQLRYRRGALHQPMGARLPARISQTRGIEDAFSGREHSRLHRDGNRARAHGHRRAARAHRAGGAGRIVRSPESALSSAAEARCEHANRGDDSAS